MKNSATPSNRVTVMLLLQEFLYLLLYGFKFGVKAKGAG